MLRRLVPLELSSHVTPLGVICRRWRGPPSRCSARSVDDGEGPGVREVADPDGGAEGGAV